MKIGNDLQCYPRFRTPNNKSRYVRAATGGAESCIAKDNVIDLMEKGWVNIAFILRQRLKGKLSLYLTKYRSMKMYGGEEV
jgi:hypothetical protein